MGAGLLFASRGPVVPADGGINMRAVRDLTHRHQRAAAVLFRNDLPAVTAVVGAANRSLRSSWRHKIESRWHGR